MIPEADQRRLLQLARDAVVAHVCGGTPPQTGGAEILDRPGAAFVTLHVRGELRGCIGHLGVDEPLGRVVAGCAVAAASSDPRFASIGRDDLPQLDVELSVLGPLEPITRVDEIEIGRHGLVVEDRQRRGLLLPQVATEWHFDAATFLAHTCRKAGLPPDAWTRGARMWRFEAEVFGEDTKDRSRSADD